MENNKYYTPTIEEFHVGFEYTKKELIDKGHNNTKLFINEDLIKSHFTTDDIRVKYLDKEDIEECGWKLNNTKDWWELGNLFPKESYKEGDHYLGNWKYRISLNSSKSNWYHIDTRNPMNGGQLQIFRGVIKNKSQLKFIMKCLEILE